MAFALMISLEQVKTQGINVVCVGEMVYVTFVKGQGDNKICLQRTAQEKGQVPQNVGFSGTFLCTRGMSRICDESPQVA